MKVSARRIKLVLLQD